MSLSIRLLGSSSAGNCTVIWTDRAAILVDFGFPLRTIRRGLAVCGLEWTQLSGAFITHLHGDHVNRSVLAALLAQRVPVFGSVGISAPLMEKLGPCGESSRRGLMWFSPGEKIDVGDLRVIGFEVPHDSPGGCCGYCITYAAQTGPKKIVLATDIGYPTRHAASMFAGADVMIIESNHDVGMLDRSGRPPALIRRIKTLGHLSNDQCADLVTSALDQSDVPPQALLLAHLSKECNTPGLAVRSAAACLRQSGFTGVQVQPASPDRPGAVITLH
jgi:phosphoribosyl 1,2-cyclic phosphodiesterase